jgi:hypothetical protein
MHATLCPNRYSDTKIFFCPSTTRCSLQGYLELIVATIHGDVLGKRHALLGLDRRPCGLRVASRQDVRATPTLAAVVGLRILSALSLQLTQSRWDRVEGSVSEVLQSMVGDALAPSECVSEDWSGSQLALGTGSKGGDRLGGDYPAWS